VTVRRLSVFVGLAAMAASAAAVDSPLTVYHDALASNPAYQAARASAEADRHGIAVARGQLLPSLSANGSFSSNEVDRNQPVLPTEHFTYQGYNYSLNLRQPIYRRYNFAQYHQAQAQFELASARSEQARAELTVKVLNAYFDALQADEIVSLLVSRKASTAAQLAAAEKSWQAGAGTRIDVDEARAKQDLIVAQEIEALQQREQTRRALQVLIGRRPEPLATLDPARLLVVPPQPADAATWVADGEANSAELAAARAQVTVAEKEVDKARAGHHPTVDLVASAGRSGNDSLSTLSNSGDVIYKQQTVGVQLQIPLFAGGQVSAGISQALERLKQAGLLADDVRNNLEVRVRREYDSVVQGQAKIAALERATASAEQTLVSVRKGVTAGVRSNLDVLAADEQVFVARRNLAQARFDYLLARVRLLAIAGRLTDEDVAGIDAAFRQ
jgi:outer membrane protein/protease secretion system outer membrane protein